MHNRNRDKGGNRQWTNDLSLPLGSYSLAKQSQETPIEEEMIYHQCKYQALSEMNVDRKIEFLLGYLATFPLGKYNGEIAQEIEYLIEELEDRLRKDKYHGVFREMRDSWLPELERHA